MKRIAILSISLSFFLGCGQPKVVIECTDFINNINKIEVKNNEFSKILTINHGFKDVAINLYRDDFERKFNHDLATYFWKLTNESNQTIRKERHSYIGVCKKIMNKKSQKERIEILKEVQKTLSEKFNIVAEKHIEQLQFKEIKGCEMFAEAIDKLQFKLFYEKNKEIKKSLKTSFNSLKNDYFGCIKIKENNKDNNETNK